MCGIAGCVAAPGHAPDRAALERMARALEHRGPDDEGIAVEGAAGLVHRRLAIVDPTSAGHAPMADAGGRWLLTYNGEVFNHLELREELPGVAWRGGSDTETLVEALARWGADAVPRCNGLFAYAALDRERGRLLLVRDRFGVKPLYLARHGGALWFASEMRALLAAGVPGEVRRDVLAHAVERGWANGPRTPLAAIERVMPGTLVEVDLETLATRERGWYDPLDAVGEEPGDLEAALRASVRRRLMADVPLGTMCSGGLDSGLITALAAEAGTVHAFNARIADQPEWDEGRWAAAVAEHLGVELHTVTMTAAEWRAELVDVVRHVEYPLTHESSVPMAAIARLARERGVKVLLSGEGADELFGGYSWLHHHAFADFAARRRPEAAARAALRALQRRGVLAGRAIPDPLPGPSAEVSAFERERFERALRAYAHHPGPRGRLEAGLAADLSTYLPHLLNRQDKATMRHSVETRVPFLDPDVVALALNMPLERRVEPERKAPLRELGRRLLPAGVVAREKVGFGFDVARYLGGAVREDFLRDGLLREALGVARADWDARVPAMCCALGPLTAEIWLRAVARGEPVGAVQAVLWADGRT
ncbi:MAG TPA: asparagine synthase (glutamine-hydrolyzing) [Thermoleophilaceae bacterium]